jgi:hypothetical protein
LASASSYALSGKVTDKSGNGIAGIWVGLTQAKIATLTASDGSWSLGATSGIAFRTAQRVAVTRHLVNEDGHLRLSFDGKDLSGRNLSGTATTSLAVLSSAASRTAEATSDTLLYVRGTSILASTVVSSTSFQAGTVALDTAARGQSYTHDGDTLRIHPRKGIYMYCSGSALSIFTLMNPKSDALYLLHSTSDGVELVSLDSDMTDSKYQYVVKLQRQSGEIGSLIGNFLIIGTVYRPLTSSVPDSVTRMITEDSTLSAQQFASLSGGYEFTKDTLVTYWKDVSFASAFLNDWYSRNYAWVYSAQESIWYDGRGTTDSAKYNITAQVVDSSTVRLTGNTTKEVVTITGTPSLNGFDQAYSSSNGGHVTGKRLAVPTSCPEAASWYEDFHLSNLRTATAARVAGPGTNPTSGRRAHDLFGRF